MQTGDTPPLVELSFLAVRYPGQRVYAKCEMFGPTRSQKDRAARNLVMTAVQRGSAGLSAGSCGNLGVALASESRKRGIACTIFVPTVYENCREEEMAHLGATVRRVSDTYEEAVRASQSFARNNRFFDANPCGEGGEIAMDAYSSIVSELFAERIGTPLTIWLPVGNGTCAAGIHRAATALGRAVRIGVVGSRGNTALTASLAVGRCVDLDPSSLRPTATNEPLVNWRSLNVDEAFAAVKDSDGFFCDADDEQLVSASSELRFHAGLHVTPAGAAGLVGLDRFRDRLAPGTTHVLLLTS